MQIIDKYVDLAGKTRITVETSTGEAMMLKFDRNVSNAVALARATTIIADEIANRPARRLERRNQIIEQIANLQVERDSL